MKQLTILFALTTVAFAVVCLLQSRKLTEQQVQMASLKVELQLKSEQVEDLEATRKGSDEQAQNLLFQTQDLNARPPAWRLAETKPVALATNNPPTPAADPNQSEDEKGGFGNFLSKMLQDPDTKKFIRDQQRGMMDQLYDPLIKRLGLTAEESAKFKDLLADNMLKGAEQASSLFGSLSSTNRTEAMNGLKAQQDSVEDEVKSILGETRYAQYQDYQQTVGERTLLNVFKQQTAGSENPLTDQQTEQLLAIMKEEKQNVATTGQTFPDAGHVEENLEAMLSDEQTDKMLQAQQSINERVFQRASQVLSPDQLDSYGRFQTSQVQMIRLGMSMARKFFPPARAEEAKVPGSR